jgi:RNA-binding protein Luc7-like 2
MDAQRALLDELMGRNRNGDRPDQEVTDFRDARVCWRFLCGLCPHDLFQNTKMDLGECAKLHAPKLKLAYEHDPRASEYGYEQELERDLVKIVSEVERKIARSQARLEEQDGAPAPSLLLDVDNCKEVVAITDEMQRVLEQAEEAGMQGQVDLSVELMAKVDELQTQRTEAQAAAMVRSFRPAAPPVENTGDGVPQPTDDDADGAGLTPAQQQNVNQKLRVCDVCGAFLSIFDSDRRLADHFGGKLHLGFLQIRKKIDQIATDRRLRRRGTVGNGASSSSPLRSRAGRGGAGVEPRRDRRSRSRSRTRYGIRTSGAEWRGLW